MQQNKRYIIQIVDTKNPVRVRIPITPGISSAGTQRVITIDAATFYTQERTQIQSDLQEEWNLNTICPQGDLVQLLFSNGFGVYNQEGKMTKVLELMDSTVQSRIVTPRGQGLTQAKWMFQRKKWHLIGSPDDFTWTQGHDLQLGFADINDNPVNFIDLKTYYTITMQINMS